MKKLVFLTGAGVSAESGISTFRDSGGLWNNYRIEDVATFEAWQKNRALVLEFYNMRRKDALKAEPNEAHLIIAELEKYFDVEVITQNVDNLHEKAGSTKILHLHGELFKARSTKNKNYVVEIDGWELKEGDKAPDGSQLRSHIVWFGEDVPMIYNAEKIAEKADIFAVVGTSLQVYPAAGLVFSVPKDSPRFVVDPHIPEFKFDANTQFFANKASEGMKELKKLLLDKYV